VSPNSAADRHQYPVRLGIARGPVGKNHHAELTNDSIEASVIERQR
jgi:hypothetical protein|tara:strand:- start:742 stop:879 length:138 start_codon:yes stop_codon:yes gene_type:complete